MSNKKFFWLKLKIDFFASKAMKKLRKIAGGDTYTIIYLKLLLLSVKTEGKLYYEGVEETFVEELALEIDEDVDNIIIVMKFLERQKLIEQGEENEYFLPEAAKAIGSETQGAERVRRFREKNKALPCNDDVTLPKHLGNTEIEKEIEKEKEKEKEIEKEIEIEKEMFAAFWAAYPRKVAKQAAMKAFEKAMKLTTLDILLDALDRHKQSAQWIKDGGNFIPHAATWLNQQRWEDELEVIGVQVVGKNDVAGAAAKVMELLGG